MEIGESKHSTIRGSIRAVWTRISNDTRSGSDFNVGFLIRDSFDLDNHPICDIALLIRHHYEDR